MAEDAQAIIEAVERLHKVELLTQGTTVFAAVPGGVTLQSVKKFTDELRNAPERKKGTTSLTSLAAFSDFVNLHKTSYSVIFVDDTNKDAPQLVAIFDAHRGTVESQPGFGPDWQEFRAIYNFPLSEEWKEWTKKLKDISQTQFAEFVEDRIKDVGTPGERVKEYAAEINVQLATPARLLELSRGLAITAEQQVTQNVNPGTGEATLYFAEAHKDSSGAPVKVPGAFALDIPVFKLGNPFQVPVRLRYKLVKGTGDSGGKVLWTIQPQRLDKVLEMALMEAEELVAQKTALKVFRGAP